MLPFILLLCVLAQGAATAQEYEYKGEVFGHVGYGKTYDDEGFLGGGLNAAGGFGYRVTPRLGLEFELSRFRHQRQAALLFKGDGFFAMGSALYYLLRSGRSQAYVIGGLGALNYSSKNQFGGTQQPTRSATALAWNVGVGMKAFVTEHFSVRPELRVFTGSAGIRDVVEPPFTVLRFSVGMGYHW